MKHSSFIDLFAFSLTVALASKIKYFDAVHDHLEICRNKTHETSSPLNYHGPSLTSHFTNDSTDLVLCPGDTFGNLNGTYITLHDCYLAIYHQEKQI